MWEKIDPPISVDGLTLREYNLSEDRITWTIRDSKEIIIGLLSDATNPHKVSCRLYTATMRLMESLKKPFTGDIEFEI